MDNASNNDTFMEALERLLRRRKVKFNRSERQIRYSSFIFAFIQIEGADT